MAEFSAPREQSSRWQGDQTGSVGSDVTWEVALPPGVGKADFTAAITEIAALEAVQNLKQEATLAINAKYRVEALA